MSSASGRWDDPAAIVAAAWFAIAPFQIFYGTEARCYSTVAALVLCSTIALLRALERGRWWWALYAVGATAALYTHYIAVLVLAPQAVWALVVHRDTVRQQLLSHAAVVLAMLPWLPFFFAQARHSKLESDRLSSLSPLTVPNAVKTELQSLVGHPYIALDRLPGTGVVVGLGVLFTGMLVAIIVTRPPGLAALRSPAGLIVVLAALPLLEIALYSLRPHSSLLLPRNLEVAAPYAALVAGVVITRFRPPIALLLALCALALLGVGTAKMMSTSYQRPDGRAAAAYIDAHAPAGAPVIDFPGPQGTQFYFKRLHPILTPAQFPPLRWAASAARGEPVFETFLHVGRCGAYAPHYRLRAERDWPSVPDDLTVCWYTPA